MADAAQRGETSHTGSLFWICTATLDRKRYFAMVSGHRALSAPRLWPRLVQFCNIACRPYRGYAPVCCPDLAASGVRGACGSCSSRCGRVPLTGVLFIAERAFCGGARTACGGVPGCPAGCPTHERPPRTDAARCPSHEGDLCDGPCQALLLLGEPGATRSGREDALLGGLLGTLATVRRSGLRSVGHLRGQIRISPGHTCRRTRLPHQQQARGGAEAARLLAGASLLWQRDQGDNDHPNAASCG